MKKLIIAFAALSFLSNCSSTEKVGGAGYTSSVAQNVLRFAGFTALERADLSSIKGKKVQASVSGFVDQNNQKFLEYLLKTGLQANDVKVVEKSRYEVELVVHVSGNDRGTSRFPIISRSDRTEGSVDFDLIIKDLNDSTKWTKQRVSAEAKYQQTRYLGVIQPDGKYYVRDLQGNWDLVDDASRIK